MPSFVCESLKHKFCAVCARYRGKNLQKYGKSKVPFADVKVNSETKSLYKQAFGMDWPSAEAQYAPSSICVACYRFLKAKKENKMTLYALAKPAIWNKPSDEEKAHLKQCYFCNVYAAGKKRLIKNHQVTATSCMQPPKKLTKDTGDA